MIELIVYNLVLYVPNNPFVNGEFATYLPDNAFYSEITAIHKK